MVFLCIFYSNFKGKNLQVILMGIIEVPGKLSCNYVFLNQ